MKKRSKKSKSRSGTTQTSAERRANGRPVCSFALPSHIPECIAAMASSLGVTRSEVVSRAVLAYYAALPRADD
jgi:hypothetical protein